MRVKTVAIASLLSLLAVPAFACRPMEGDVFDELTSPYLVLAVADVTDLPYPDTSIDLAVSSLSMHEWPDLDPAAHELHRILRPGATLAVYDFRFARTVAVQDSLRARFGTVESTAIRLPWHPVAVVTRYLATA